MIAALVILALATPLLVGAAFVVGVTMGHRLSRGESPAQAPAEAIVAAKQAVTAVIGKGEAAVPTELDEYQLEQERNQAAIQAALLAQLNGQ